MVFAAWAGIALVLLGIVRDDLGPAFWLGVVVILVASVYLVLLGLRLLKMAKGNASRDLGES